MLTERESPAQAKTRVFIEQRVVVAIETKTACAIDLRLVFVTGTGVTRIADARACGAEGFWKGHGFTAAWAWTYESCTCGATGRGEMIKPVVITLSSIVPDA